MSIGMCWKDEIDFGYLYQRLGAKQWVFGKRVHTKSGIDEFEKIVRKLAYMVYKKKSRSGMENALCDNKGKDY